MRLRIVSLLLLAGCSTSSPEAPRIPDASVPGDTCGGIRLTSYAATAVGWCEWDRTLPFLPAFVRNGMTTAIAEPFDGGSYRGDPGESCGECWEIDTLSGTEVVMVHDLCPIQGNPICDGSYFHFDLADEAGAVLLVHGRNEGSARRVPCPVSGNVHVQVNDLNPGYLRAAFLNHRIPIRSVSLRGAGAGVATDNPWIPMVRSGGAFELDVGGRTLANGGTGIAIRLESAQGELLELPTPIPVGTANGTAIDLGAQLTDQVGASSATCRFYAPSDVYVDGYGGIDQVRWQFDGWSPAVVAAETSSGCAAGSCLHIDGIAQWSGFHLYYVQSFPTSDFSSLKLALRTASGSGSVLVAPSFEGATCTKTEVALTTAFTEVTLDLASLCTGTAAIDGITIQAADGLSLIVDDVRFVQ